MPILKIDSNSVNPASDYTFSDITVDSITSAGHLIDGILDKTYTVPGKLTSIVGTTRWWIPTNISIIKIIGSVGTSPTGSSVTFVINKNATQIQTISISSGQNTASADVNISASAGDYITLDITATGSSVSGSDLSVTFLYARRT